MERADRASGQTLFESARGFRPKRAASPKQIQSESPRRLVDGRSRQSLRGTAQGLQRDPQGGPVQTVAKSLMAVLGPEGEREHGDTRKAHRAAATVSGNR